jgi:hypothetical protein
MENFEFIPLHNSTLLFDVDCRDTPWCVFPSLENVEPIEPAQFYPGLWVARRAYGIVEKIENTIILPRRG